MQAYTQEMAVRHLEGTASGTGFKVRTGDPQGFQFGIVVSPFMPDELRSENHNYSFSVYLSREHCGIIDVRTNPIFVGEEVNENNPKRWFFSRDLEENFAVFARAVCRVASHCPTADRLSDNF